MYIVFGTLVYNSSGKININTFYNFVDFKCRTIMRNIRESSDEVLIYHSRDSCGVRTHDPEVARQRPYHRSPRKLLSYPKECLYLLFESDVNTSYCGNQCQHLPE